MNDHTQCQKEDSMDIQGTLDPLSLEEQLSQGLHLEEKNGQYYVEEENVLEFIDQLLETDSQSQC